VSIGCEEDGPFTPHLDTFNAKSFASLSRVNLTLPFTIYSDNDPIDRKITNPYMSFCDSFLGKLRNLETLDIDIHFQGYHLLLPESYGPQWGRLADVLATPGAFTQLKHVGVSVSIRMIDRPPYDKDWPTAEQKRDAEQLDHNLKTLVYPAQFGRLHDLNIAGRRLDFSFTTNITTGGPILV
jgi:hypothetical protein